MSNRSREIFAKNLKRYMESKGISQKELASIVGVSAPTVNEWIKEKKYPRIDKIEKLANFFGCLKSDLIEDKEKQIVRIGERIKRRRQELEWSQRELAAKMKYSHHSTLARIENGQIDVRQSKIVQFAEVLGVSVSYLMGWEENENKEQPTESELSIKAKERAERINKLVKESGKSYKELEAITGVTKSCLQRYATGERHIPISAVEKIATAFNVSATYIMWGEEKQSAYGELSEIQKNFIQKVAMMSDDVILKIERFLALLD